MENVGNVRQRKQLKTLKAFKELDAFPKIPENYQQTSISGGSVSVLSFLFIFVLVVSEFWYYRGTETKYSYAVDTDVDSKLQLNVDLTIAMKCEDIDADVLDLSGSTIQLGDSIKLKPTYFKLSPEQEMWLALFRDFHYFHEGYRPLGEVEGYNPDLPTYMPERGDSDKNDGKEHDACRVHGSFQVNRVAGNFHITTGKSIHHPRGHAHLSSMVPVEALNFSHRIDNLSFGSRIPGFVHPLDGEMQVTETKRQMYQYYIQVVPTKIQNFGHKEIKTNQYSVTQRIREISHTAGSHGIPGVFFKYDLSSIMVKVDRHHRSVAGFLVRLCGIVGGIFATSGMLHDLVGFIVDVLMCRYGNKKQKAEQDASQSPPPTPSSIQSESNGPVTPATPLSAPSSPGPATPAGLTSSPEGLANNVKFAPSTPASPENTSQVYDTRM